MQLHCQHRTASGRRCRMAVSEPDSRLCFRHAADQKKDRDLAALAATLTGDAEGFNTPEGINHSLGKLYKLLADNKISSRRAAVLAYISNLLLRTLVVIDHRDKSEGEDERQIIIDIPRPQRD